MFHFQIKSADGQVLSTELFSDEWALADAVRAAAALGYRTFVNGKEVFFRM